MKIRLFVKPTAIMRRRRRREFILLCCLILTLLLLHLSLVHVIDITFEEKRELQEKESKSASIDESLQTDSTTYIEQQKKNNKHFCMQSVVDWIASLSPFVYVESRLETIPAPPPLNANDITTRRTSEEREDNSFPSYEEEFHSVEVSQKPVSKHENVPVEEHGHNANKNDVVSCSTEEKEGSEHERCYSFNYNIKSPMEITNTDYTNNHNQYDHHIRQDQQIFTTSSIIGPTYNYQNSHNTNKNGSTSFLSTWRTKETTYEEALVQYHHNLHVALPKGNPEQPSHEYTDLDSDSEGGIALPYTVYEQQEEEQLWKACDTLNASFSSDRDARCQEYLANVNNMRSIRAMDSHLLQGRTIKMKIQYAHNNIEAIVKISQRKFVFEAASEYMAFVVDRAIGFNRVPTTIYTLLPLNFLRVAAAYSALYSQWFNRYVELYDKTQQNFVPCYQGDDGAFHAYETKRPEQLENGDPMCVYVAIQLWMREVHPTLDSFLALPYEYDDRFAEKYYVPGHPLFSSIRPSRLRAIGELLDRFIFDFLIGNSDRGMNDHNNFVYGGCSLTTECAVPKDPSARLKGLAKYAYLDHGSSLYSHKEVEGNPFFGEVNRIKICRFRRSTVESLRAVRSTSRQPYLFIKHIEQHIPPPIYNIIPPSIIRKMQNRLDKVVRLTEKCEQTFTKEVVYSLPSYDSIRIAEEDVFQTNEIYQEFNY